ncbi:MAG: hypothetical protein MI892_08685, partial [Desulfobacterales bacterium]|nr:hypothetical protein [Desulfobacterales bacterium]
MNGLVLLINIGIIIVSIVSVISYLRNRNKLQRRQKAAKEHLVGSRLITDDEVQAFKHFYNKTVTGDTQVYTVTGAYESIGLRVQHTTSSEHWIGGIKVALVKPHMEGRVREHGENYCEFVYVSGKKNLAYPLLLNGSSLLEGFEGEPSEDPTMPNSSASLNARSWRDITHTEQRFMRRERKIFGALLLLPCAVLLHAGFAFSSEAVHIEHANYPILIPGLICLVASFWLLFMKRPYRTSAQQVLGITGKLRKQGKEPGRPAVRYSLEGTNYQVALPKRYVILADIKEDEI